MDWPGSFLFVAAIGMALVTITGQAKNNVGRIDLYIEYIRIPIINFYICTRAHAARGFPTSPATKNSWGAHILP